MLVANGQVDSENTPLIEIEVWGTDPSLKKKYKVVLDTGFNGFLSISEKEAKTLGIVCPGDTTQVVYGNGQAFTGKIAKGNVSIGGLVRHGVFLCDTDSEELLLGMEFIELFDLTLYLSGKQFVLLDKEVMTAIVKTLDVVAKAALEHVKTQQKSAPASPSSPTEPQPLS
jgi:predicted aspartyl protease